MLSTVIAGCDNLDHPATGRRNAQTASAVKSNPAAVLDPIKWASIVSGAALS